MLLTADICPGSDKVKSEREEEERMISGGRKRMRFGEEEEEVIVTGGKGMQGRGSKQGTGKEQCVVPSLAHWLTLGSSMSSTLHMAKIPTLMKIRHGYLG